MYNDGELTCETTVTYSENGLTQTHVVMVGEELQRTDIQVCDEAGNLISSEITYAVSGDVVKLTNVYQTVPAA